MAWIAAVLVASCSEKPGADRKKISPDETATPRQGEHESQPHEDEIAEDCVTFLRATKVSSAQSARADCAACPAEGAEVLKFQQMQTNRISCSANACEVVVTIHASFNPGAGETIGGGLTAWIPPEQRTNYLGGNIPQGEQIYRVKITYKQDGEKWRPIEFDKAE